MHANLKLIPKKERIMNSFKYFVIILASVVFVSTVFAVDKEDLRQRGAMPVQDWRKQTLTPEIARDLAQQRAKMKGSQHKIIDITDHDIENSGAMPESVKQSISGGAYINAVDKHGNALLHYICNAQNMNLALQFIEYGAKLLPNNTGIRPQDLISNQYLACTGRDCTYQEIEILRTFLRVEERKYSVPHSHISKKMNKRK